MARDKIVGLEVRYLDDIEKEIDKAYGSERKVKVLNVQKLKRREFTGYLNGIRQYENEYYYKVFVSLGNTPEQDKLEKEDREFIRKAKKERERQLEDEEIYEMSLSTEQLYAYRKRKKEDAQRELNRIEAEKKEKQSLQHLEKKLEEAKVKAANTKTSSVTKLIKTTRLFRWWK